MHGSSGLTRNFQPKKSFWAIKHLYDTLGEYRFNRVVSKAQDDLYVYEFVHGGDKNAMIWVAWSPTGSGREKEMSIKDLPRKPRRIERMPTQEGTAPEVDWKSTGPGAISLKITEAPVYIAM